VEVGVDVGYRARRLRLAGAAFATALMLLSAVARSAIYRCVDANGTSTFADRPCADAHSDRPSSPGNSAGSGSELNANHDDSDREKKAARILDELRITSAEPETPVLQRTVDEAAPDLVKALDPDNAAWTPANGRWHSVSEFVKADLRRDVQSALRASTAQNEMMTAREYAARAKDSDLDALSAYLATADGTRYIAFQSYMRPLLYEARSAMLAQEAIPAQVPSDAVLRQRKQLLSMALAYRVAKDGGGPAPAELQLGSTTVVEYAARQEGTALDALYAEYEAFLPAFQAFTDSPTAKHFFAAVEPAMRTERALSSTATTDFAEMEFDKYAQRWHAIYGPQVRVAARTTVVIRGRTVSISRTANLAVSAAGSPEAMAIQCEQREYARYQSAHAASRDPNAQAAAYSGIQGRCRAEQRLPPL
jgi:Domain of unknown function (DUF4124)